MSVRPLGVWAAAAAGVVALASASAHASLFSFASDTNTGPTFVGTAGGVGGTAGAFDIRDSGPSNQFQLVIDDNNGPAPSAALGVRFEANMRAQWVATTPIAGPTVLHSYSVINGPLGAFAFRFSDLTTGETLLSASLDGGTQGVFSVVGTNSSWSSAGAIRASDSFAAVTWTATQALVNKLIGLGVNPETYGIRAGASIGPDDFGFDLTALVTDAGGGVAINQNTHAPTTGWHSEGSFSGSAVSGIPSPGSVVLMGMCGLLSIQRRRRTA